MKYLEKYICSLSKNVEIIRSKSSYSTYIILDDGFKIRLSDHIPNHIHDSVKMDIISIFNREDFLFFMGESHIPVVKNRNDIKNHIKITYENWMMSKMRLSSDIKHNGKDKSLKDCKTLDDYISLFGDKTFDYSYFASMYGNTHNGRQTPKEVRKYMTTLIDEEKISAPLLFYLCIKHNRPFKTIQNVDDLLEKNNLLPVKKE